MPMARAGASAGGTCYAPALCPRSLPRRLVATGGREQGGGQRERAEDDIGSTDLWTRSSFPASSVFAGGSRSIVLAGADVAAKVEARGGGVGVLWLLSKDFYFSDGLG